MLKFAPIRLLAAPMKARIEKFFTNYAKILRILLKFVILFGIMKTIRVNKGG